MLFGVVPWGISSPNKPELVLPFLSLSSATFVNQVLWGCSSEWGHQMRPSQGLCCGVQPPSPRGVPPTFPGLLSRGACSPSDGRRALFSPPNDCLLSSLSHFGCGSSFGSRWRKKSHYSRNTSGFWIQLLSKRLPLTSFSTRSPSQGSGAEIRYFCCNGKLTVHLCVERETSVQISCRLNYIPRSISQCRNVVSDHRLGACWLFCILISRPP